MAGTPGRYTGDIGRAGAGGVSRSIAFGAFATGLLLTLGCFNLAKVVGVKPVVVVAPKNVRMGVGLSHDVAIEACQPSFVLTTVILEELDIAVKAVLGDIRALWKADQPFVPNCEPNPAVLDSLTLEGEAFKITGNSGQQTPGVIVVTVEALAEGKGTLRVKVTSGETVSEQEVALASVPVDGIEVKPRCQEIKHPASGTVSQTKLAVGAELTVNAAWTAGGEKVAGYREGSILSAEGLEVVSFTSASTTFRAPATPGKARIVSAFVPGFAYEMEVVDVSRVDALALAAGDGLAQHDSVIVLTWALVDGEHLCQPESFRRTTADATPEICHVLDADLYPDALSFVVVTEHVGTCEVHFGLVGSSVKTTRTWDIVMGAERLGGPQVNAVWAVAPNDLYAVGGPSGTTLAHWDGTQWKTVLVNEFWCAQEGLGTLEDLWGSGPTDVVALGGTVPICEPQRGYLLKYDGAEWKTAYTGSVPLHTLWGSGPNEVWAAGNDGLVLRRQAGSWVNAETGLDTQFLDLWGSGAGEVWGVGYHKPGDAGVPVADIVHFDGQTWHREAEDLIAAGNVYTCRGVWARSAADVYAVCETTAFHFDGTAWTEVKDLAGMKIWGRGGSELFLIDRDLVCVRIDATTRYAFPDVGFGLSVWGRDQDVWWVASNGVFHWGGP